MDKGKEQITIRSSAAEYLTYVASTGEQQDSIEMRYEDENIWLTQKMMAALYDVTAPTINEHIKKIFADSELQPEATIRKFRIVQSEGTRQVSREVNHYSLQMIIAVGFKVNSERAVQFRKWVNQIAKEYTIKGWVMDDERLKRGTYLTDKYFEEQLERVREIRASERLFYQKITDLYATAVDYDKTAAATRRFYATVQNKMHYAVHGHTAAELIMERADSAREYMGLTTWQDAPDGKIKKSDVRQKMLQLQDIAWSAPDGERILKGVSLTVPDDTLMVITGPNGGGKTTLAKVIAGLERPESGRILLDGEDITDLNVTERARRGVSYAFQQPVRFKGLVVRQLLELAAGEKLSEARLCDVLSQVGLCAREYIDREVNATLSGGEIKRIEIATVLLRHSRLSIFDEPEAGIDLWSFNNLITVFQSLRSTLHGSMVIISHQERILQIADEIAVISGGELTHQGKAEEILPELMRGAGVAACCRQKEAFAQ